MKLSDYVSDYVASLGVRHVFVITGGADLHLIDSFSKNSSLTCVCNQHEQASAMAADAYSRVTGNIGVAVSTTGPGATNLITGCCCAYYDSVPVLYITGQVASFRLKGDSGVRQLGFQETETVDMFKSITKYAVLLKEPNDIRYELEKAIHIAKSGRPGPVLIDIPDNFQRVDINPEELKSFFSQDEVKKREELNLKVKECIELINNAKRPVLILGWGIRLSNAEEEVKKLIEVLQIPVLLTWGAMDFIPYENPLLVGGFGLHGTRFGNFTVQNADLIFTIGTRLDTHLTGTPISSFGREAKKIIVDIDECELNKFKTIQKDDNLLIQADAKEFVNSILRVSEEIKIQDILCWKNKIMSWKELYPICLEEYYKEKNVNPYVFVKFLSKELEKNEIIFADTGCSIAWMLQAFEFKEGQRLFSAFNNTPMGYSLPASTGASFALNGKQVICVTGDGGLQMNIQELATIDRHKLPIKIFVINNYGYGMIQQTQEQWLDSNYVASTIEGGLAVPDFIRIAEAYNFKTVVISKNTEIETKIKEVLSLNEPVLCNVEVSSLHRVIPQVVFGRTIEDSEPLLPREEFLNQMIVKPAEVSLK